MLRRPAALFAGYIFDLDGTLLLGDALLPGARRLIETLHALDRHILYVTNNPTKAAAAVVARLVHDGIPATTDEVINTVTTTVHWLKTHAPDATVYPIAEAPVLRALTAAGIRTSTDGGIIMIPVVGLFIFLFISLLIINTLAACFYTWRRRRQRLT